MYTVSYVYHFLLFMIPDPRSFLRLFLVDGVPFRLFFFCRAQGAFYILSQPLVEYLYRGHEHLECFTNEDVTIGSWLMGVRVEGRGGEGS